MAYRFTYNIKIDSNRKISLSAIDGVLKLMDNTYNIKEFKLKKND